MKTENHEVIFAIVNAGFAEDVMDVARENGARGGTILNARGVVKEDTAHFFGITVHADKEILMMVVEKTIRDRVLNVIYKEMGMAKKSQRHRLLPPRLRRSRPGRTGTEKKRNDFYKKAPERVLFCGQNYKQRKQR